MREILFRGKRMDNGEWVEGDLVRSYLKIGNACITDFAKGVVLGVDNSTVGQYTDLEDKNGERIFEGDIVRYGKKTGVVNWGIGCFSVKTFVPVGYYNNPAIDIVLNEYPNDIEVIGNIHDNPELLEEARPC